MTDAQILSIGRQAAQCIREHGLSNFPDPVVSAGQLTLPNEDEALSAPGAQAAVAACRSILDRLPPSALGEDDRPGPEDVSQLVKFAQCIREHGVPDWPDPKADGTFPLTGTAVGREVKSPRVQQAMDACKQYWDGGISAS